jgi:hypothetical protein
VNVLFAVRVRIAPERQFAGPGAGQTARLIPQPEVDYAISYDSQNVYTVPRRDGMIMQEWSPGDYGNEKEVTYPEATRTSVAKIASLRARMGPAV